jgi:hypothetical protein
MHHIQKRRITAANKNLMTRAGMAAALVDPHSSVTACTILVEGVLKLVDLILRSFKSRSANGQEDLILPPTAFREN